MRPAAREQAGRDRRGALRGALLALGLSGGGAAAAAPQDEPTFVLLTLPLGGRLLDFQLQDLDGDRRAELTIAVSPRGSRRRELRVHRPTAEGLLETEPAYVVPVLDDVVAWSIGDVRQEPGSELLLLTRGGAWSYSLRKEGYRDNAARLAEAELLYDVPDAGTLPFWRYVLAGNGGPLLLLPVADGYQVWGPPFHAPGTGDLAPGHTGATRQAYVVTEESRSGLADLGRRGRIRGQVGIGGQPLSFSVSRGHGVLLEHDPLPAAATPLLAAERRQRAPALVDVDGDGLDDLLLRQHHALHVHLQGPAGLASEPTRVEAYPAYLVEGEIDLQLVPHDLDGDGDVDLLARLKREHEGLLATNATFDLLVLRNDGGALLPPEPHQILRLEATEVELDVADVDGDGRKDLVATKSVAPDLTDLTSPAGLIFERTTLVFLGLGGARFEPRPSIRRQDTFDESRLGEAVRARRLAVDCSGDGRADLVEVGLDGQVVIRRVQKERGFFGGGSLVLEDAPWRRFPGAGSLNRLYVGDVNGDGLGDVVSGWDDRVALLLSQRRTR